MTESTPVVYVVDEDSSLRQSLELLCQSVGWRSQTYATVHGFLNMNRNRFPACLVMDLHLSDCDGLELQHKIAIDQPSVPIIFITALEDMAMAVHAMKNGAVEVLTKPVDEAHLLLVLERAIALSSDTLALEEDMRILRDRYASLSPREQEVMSLVAAGQLNKTVGAQLGISEITVKAHRGNVMRKMSASSLAQLVIMASLLGVVAASTYPHSVKQWELGRSRAHATDGGSLTLSGFHGPIAMRG